MGKTFKLWKPAIGFFLIMTALCGVVYPGIVTGIAQTLFPVQANGSVLSVTRADGTRADVGSALIGQEFTDPKYLIGRPMGVTNLSPVSAEQQALVGERAQWLRSIDPGNAADIPADLVTASGSGADPYVSPEAAAYQAERIARVRGMRVDDVRAILERYTSGRFLGFWGEPAVHVLKVNLALDGLE